MKWLTNIWKRANGERRKAPRHAIPMVAYYWNGGCAIPHAVQNISRHGAFVRTGVTWGLGTSLLLHLREDEAAWLLHASASSISVMATVVRHTTEGMGLRLLFTNPKERRSQAGIKFGLCCFAGTPRTVTAWWSLHCCCHCCSC